MNWLRGRIPLITFWLIRNVCEWSYPKEYDQRQVSWEE